MARSSRGRAASISHRHSAGLAIPSIVLIRGLGERVWPAREHSRSSILICERSAVHSRKPGSSSNRSSASQDHLWAARLQLFSAAAAANPMRVPSPVPGRHPCTRTMRAARARARSRRAPRYRSPRSRNATLPLTWDLLASPFLWESGFQVARRSWCRVSPAPCSRALRFFASGGSRAARPQVAPRAPCLYRPSASNGPRVRGPQVGLTGAGAAAIGAPSGQNARMTQW